MGAALKIPAEETAANVAESAGEERFVLRNVSWETYERLIADWQDQSHFRVFYDNGMMEIMSPSLKHEVYNRAISSAIDLMALDLNIDVINAGSTTLKLKRKKRGAEPDTCFYVRNEALMRGKTEVDLKTDPPPDVIFEVDISSGSVNKFLIYAAFGVPELWRYDGKNFRIYQLEGRRYVEAGKSLTFPWLTAESLADFMQCARTKGQSAALRDFRDRLKRQRARRKKPTK
jgi:Uma2 family endonuclease